jgi:hypothetical protein
MIWNEAPFPAGRKASAAPFPADSEGNWVRLLAHYQFGM